MLGVRFVSAMTLIFGLASLAITIGLSVAQTKNQIQADVETISAALQADNRPSVKTLRQQFPIQYARVQLDSGTVAEIFGQFKQPQHPLGQLLPVTLAQASTVTPEYDAEVGLDIDLYFQRHNTGLLLSSLALTALTALLLLLVQLRAKRFQQDLNTLSVAIERLPSLELPNMINGLQGKLTPLSHVVIQTRDQLRSQLQSLHRINTEQAEDALRDPITQLANRASFNLDMEDDKSDNKGQGHLVLLRASALNELNNRMGSQAGDAYLATIAGLLQRIVSNQSKLAVYRYSGADFLIRCPNMEHSALIKLVEPITKQLSDIAQRENISAAGYVGAAPYGPEERISQLLIHADTAISIAQANGPNSFFCMDEVAMSLDLDTDHWQEVLDDVIEHQRLELIQQAIRSPQDDKTLYRELFVRFTNHTGQPLPTETLFAKAATHGRTIELDQMIFSRVANEINHNSDPNISYGLNLATRSITDPKFLYWLEDRIQKTPALKGRLVFEISEHSIELNPEPLRIWFRRMHQLGVRIAIDRFGHSLTSFRTLSALRPDFVKLAPHFTKSIDRDADNRFFIKMLLDVAVRLEIRVIATHVEQYEERMTLEALRLDGLQGHLLQAPSPIMVKEV
ncbi:GGDEF domain-containing protein [Ferrimonas pelagia]|uniref:GGDEF domain-containing protein n=1 Tax=Ferrimonas pelagia TaxID=1177826 RepID=A0ABP9EBA8_9GAMM